MAGAGCEGVAEADCSVCADVAEGEACICVCDVGVDGELLSSTGGLFV